MNEPPAVRSGFSPRVPAFICFATLAISVSSGIGLESGRELSLFPLDNWQVEDQLPQNTVQALVQSRDGYLWMGTQEGLVRFDGVRFTLFDRKSPGNLPSNDIQTLVEGHDGSLWMTTVGDSLARFGLGRFEELHDSDGRAIEDATVLHRSRDGRSIWIGTTQRGVLRAGPGGELKATLSTKKESWDRVSCILEDTRGDLWIGSVDGLWRSRAGELVRFSTRDGLPSDRVTALVEDARGRLWVGTDSGLAFSGDAAQTPFRVEQRLAAEAVRTLCVDRDANLWVGTAQGLRRITGQRMDALGIAGGLPAADVVSILEDREGSLWVGTNGGGLCRLKNGKLVTFLSARGLQGDIPYSVCGDGAGGLWVGSYRSGLYRFKAGQYVRVLPASRLDTSRIRCLLPEGDNVLWISTERQLFRYEPGLDRLTTPLPEPLPSSVRAIALGSDGIVWLGTDSSGLYRLGPDGLRHFTQKDGLAGDEVRALVMSADGALWVGTYGGLSRLRNGVFKNYTTANGLLSDRVRTLTEDADGALWIGTYGSGLARFKQGKFKNFTTGDGLFHDVMFQIVDDRRGRLWMSCNKGLFYVDKEELDLYVTGRPTRLTCVAFGRADGMASSECNGGSPGGWRDEDGKLWFPCLKGLVRVDPANIPVNRLPPPVVIEELIADGQPLEILSAPVLDVPPRRIEFRFTALSFLAPDRVKFAYKIDGVDERWVESGTARGAAYTRLSPGSYVMHVIACNNDSAWNMIGASLAFTIEPRFYQTWVFKAGMAIPMLGLLYGVYRLRVRALTRRQNALQRKVDEAVSQIKVLRGLLPICAACKKIRDDTGYWNNLESYLLTHSEATFTHGICPDCMLRLYPDVFEEDKAPNQRAGSS